MKVLIEKPTRIQMKVQNQKIWIVFWFSVFFFFNSWKIIAVSNNTEYGYWLTGTKYDLDDFGRDNRSKCHGLQIFSGNQREILLWNKFSCVSNGDCHLATWWLEWLPPLPQQKKHCHLNLFVPAIEGWFDESLFAVAFEKVDVRLHQLWRKLRWEADILLLCIGVNEGQVKQRI